MSQSIEILASSDLAAVTGGAWLPSGYVDPFYQAKRLDPRYRTWRGGVQQGMQRPHFMFPSGRLSTLERMQLGLPIGLR